jgi:hypothetical protein
MKKLNAKLQKDRAKKAKLKQQKMREDEKRREKAEKKAAKKKNTNSDDEEGDDKKEKVAGSDDNQRGVDIDKVEIVEHVSIGFADGERLSKLVKRSFSIVCSTTASRSSLCEIFDSSTLSSAQQVTVSNNPKYYQVKKETLHSEGLSPAMDLSKPMVVRSGNEKSGLSTLPPLPRYWDDCIEPFKLSADRRGFKVKSLRFTPKGCAALASVSTAVDFQTSSISTLMLEPVHYHIRHKSVLEEEIEAMLGTNPKPTIASSLSSTRPQMVLKGNADVSEPPLMQAGSVCYGLLGPVLGTLEPEDNDPAKGIGIWTADSSITPIEAAGIDATATYKIRVLFEVTYSLTLCNNVVRSLVLILFTCITQIL